MSSFKSQDDLLTAVPGERYSFIGATLRATTPHPASNSTTVATTQWVNTLLGVAPSPPVVLDAGGLNITYTSGTVINSLTNTVIHITGASLPLAVDASSTEYVWVRYLDEAVIATTVAPSNNQGYLIATITTNGGSVVSITANANVAGWAPINNPSFSGVVTVPTPALTDNSNKVPSTSWVRSLIQSTLVGSDFPTLSISSSGTGILWSSGSVTVEGMQYPVLGGQYNFTSSSNGVMKLYAVIIGGTTIVLVSALAPTTPHAFLGSVYVVEGAVVQVSLPSTNGFAPIDSPTFTGNPQAPAPSSNDRDNSIATTGWVVDVVTTKMGVGFGGYVTYLP
jgi:hypothetical protein